MADVSRHPLEDILKNDPEAAEAYDALSFEEQKAYWHEQELAAHLTVRDVLNPDVIHQLTPVAAVEPKFKIKVAGQEFTADTLEELNAKYEPALKAVLAASQAKANDVPRNSNGTFAKQPSITDGVDQITDDLVLKSLQAQGIDPDALREASACKAYEKSWARATNEFLKTTSDYRGGEGMVQVLGTKIIELGLDDAPSAENLRKAWESVKADNNRLDAIANAKSPAEIEELIGKTHREADRLQRGR